MTRRIQDIIDALPDMEAVTVVVQLTSLLKVMGRDQAGGWVDVLHHDGQFDRMSAAHLLRTHFAIEGGAYLKPHYRPMRALVMLEPEEVVDVNGPRHLGLGDVILIDGATAFAVLSREDYLRDYEALRPGQLQMFLTGSRLLRRAQGIEAQVRQA